MTSSALFVAIVGVVLGAVVNARAQRAAGGSHDPAPGPSEPLGAPPLGRARSPPSDRTWNSRRREPDVHVPFLETSSSLQPTRPHYRSRRRSRPQRPEISCPPTWNSRCPLTPGHWEGDLIVGAGHRSAIGTLVERTSRYVLLLHLPEGGTAEAVNTAMAEASSRLPAELGRSVT